MVDPKGELPEVVFCVKCEFSLVEGPTLAGLSDKRGLAPPIGVPRTNFGPWSALTHLSLYINVAGHPNVVENKKPNNNSISYFVPLKGIVWGLIPQYNLKSPFFSAHRPLEHPPPPAERFTGFFTEMLRYFF